MANIKIVSWDVYGTLIRSCDDEKMPEARPGALEILAEIKSRGIIQCTSSDGNIKNLRSNLGWAGIETEEFFDQLYKMPRGEKKDFSGIIEHYGISPNKLLVIGDNYNIDISLAKEQGCQTFHTPEPIKCRQNQLDVETILKIIENK